jgi:hypothetical protein
MAADESANIATISTRFVYENRWMRVREDTICPDGQIKIRVPPEPDWAWQVAVADPSLDGFRVHAQVGRDELMGMV